jgi:CDP-glucose 4,6-dehydratase
MDGNLKAGAWNFGPLDSGERPVRWVVNRFLEAWGSGSWRTPTVAGPAPHEAHRLSLDSTKAREQLGWAPVWDGPTAVLETASWYREYYRSPATARRLVDDQLARYQGDARAAGLAWAAADEGGTTG